MHECTWSFRALDQEWYRRLFVLLIAAVLLGCLCLVGFGCAATPADRWFQARAALTAAGEVFVAKAPTLSDQEIVYYGGMLQSAREFLANAREDIDTGGEQFDMLLNMVEIILGHMAALEREEEVGALPAEPDHQPGAVRIRLMPVPTTQGSK